MAKIITAFVAENLNKVHSGKISFSRFIEMLNEKAKELEAKQIDDLKEQDLLVLYAEKELKRDQIVYCASRMIKDIDSEPVRGMIEVGNRFVEELNNLMFDLGQIENKIADLKI